MLIINLLSWTQLQHHVVGMFDLQEDHPQILLGLSQTSSVSWKSKQEIRGFRAKESGNGFEEISGKTLPREGRGTALQSPWEVVGGIPYAGPTCSAWQRCQGEVGKVLLVSKQLQMKTVNPDWLLDSQVHPRAQLPILPPKSALHPMKLSFGWSLFILFSKIPALENSTTGFCLWTSPSHPGSPCNRHGAVCEGTKERRRKDRSEGMGFMEEEAEGNQFNICYVISAALWNLY